MRGMPDRFWWLQRAIGTVLAAGCSITLLWLVVTLFTSYSSAYENQSGQLLWEQPLALIGGYALLVASGIFIIWGSVRAQDRHRRRMLAMQGDQDAMLRATIKVDADDAPNLSSGPLELLWRPSLLLRFIAVLLNLILLPLFGFLAGLGVYLAYSIVTTQMQLSLLARAGLLLLDVGFVVGGASFILIVLLYASLPALFVKPRGVMANADGILYLPPHIGRSRFLRWEEIRLFELDQIDEGRPGRCRLYGTTAIVRWSNQPPSKGASLGLTKQDFIERHQALLNLIAARTRLLPRTLDKRLAEPSSV